jgi:hypothetical protein
MWYDLVVVHQGLTVALLLWLTVPVSLDLFHAVEPPLLLDAGLRLVVVAFSLDIGPTAQLPTALVAAVVSAASCQHFPSASCSTSPLSLLFSCCQHVPSASCTTLLPSLLSVSAPLTLGWRSPFSPIS